MIKDGEAWTGVLLDARVLTQHRPTALGLSQRSQQTSLARIREKLDLQVARQTGQTQICSPTDNVKGRRCISGCHVVRLAGGPDPSQLPAVQVLIGVGKLEYDHAPTALIRELDLSKASVVMVATQVAVADNLHLYESGVAVRTAHG